ncbi:MAG: Hpt domain-containing protein [Planctomycetes bacterium]|nr:Hpt domain-containing protein [Planctomycetota bacterium]
MSDILDDDTSRKAREPEKWDPGEYQELLSTVVNECEENLDHLARNLLKLEKTTDRETIDSLFRAAHNLKGLSKVIVIDKLNLIAREMENLLESIRQGQRKPTPELIDVLLEATDVVRSDILPCLSELRVIEKDITAILEKLVLQRRAGPVLQPRQPAALRDLAPAAAAPEASVPTAAAIPADLPVAEPALEYAADAPSPSPAAPVARSAEREGGAGEVRGAGRSEPPTPPARASSPSPAAPAPSPSPAAAGEGRGEGRSEPLRAPASPPPPAPALAVPPPAANHAALEAAADKSAGPDQSQRVALSKLDKLMDLVSELVIGKIRYEQHVTNLRSLSAELRRCRRRLRTATSARPTIDFLRSLALDMDRLIWQVSLREESSGRWETVRSGMESLITGYHQHQVEGYDRRRDTLDGMVDELDRIERVYDELVKELLDSTDQLGLLTNELQENVMKIRMVPVAQVFNKFPRMVREISRTLGKRVNLSVAGESTELDKMLVEQVGEPLMHIIRNAIDHGIESPAERAAAAKPEEGNLTLRAYHKSSQIYIEVSDDGRGIDPAGLRKAAVAKGFFTEAEVGHLTDPQVMDLIFFPGFSTAKQVTDVSGRGVGLDVV